MKPVDMIHLKNGEPGAENGDCMRACVASILNLTVDEVPHFCANPDANLKWLRRTNEWLNVRGLYFLEVNPIKYCWLKYIQESHYFMAGGKSPRGDWGHWVVAKCTKGTVEIVHDPHPSREGLNGDPDSYGIFIKLNK